jgi:hypothetical protein
VSRRPVLAYPHAGGCPECAARRECNACGAGIGNDRGRCTNGRCAACHATKCTPGGGTAPGHGFGAQGGAHYGPRPLGVEWIYPRGNR